MTRRPQQRAKPSEPRYAWPISASLPREHKPDPMPEWTGTLSLNPGAHVGGTLSHGGWTLGLQGLVQDPAQGGMLCLRGTVMTRGLVALPFEDFGLTAEMTQRAAHGSWLLMMERNGDGFLGTVCGTGWHLAVQGTPFQPGRLRLRGVVGAA